MEKDEQLTVGGFLSAAFKDALTNYGPDTTAGWAATLFLFLFVLATIVLYIGLGFTLLHGLYWLLPQPAITMPN